MLDHDSENAFRILENETKKRILSIRKDISNSAIHSDVPITEIKVLAEKVKQFEDIAKQLASIKQILNRSDNKRRSFKKEYVEEGRAHKGEKTPNIEYRIPILIVLKEMGGSGQTKKVLEKIFSSMKNRLSKKDMEFLPSGTDIRWQNAAMWERYSMVKGGLLSTNSPRGLWEIATKGYKYLELNSK